MKLHLITATFLLAISAPSFAAQNCEGLASKAAQQLYSLSDRAAPVLKTEVQNNPNNSSNGVSLIVTLNSNQRYLVLLTSSSPAGGPDCNGVEYVIAYPYANLIEQ